MDRTDILASCVVSALSLAALGCGATKPPPPAQTAVSAPPQNSAPPAVNEPVPAANLAMASAAKAPAKVAPGRAIAEPAKPAAAPVAATATPVKASPAPAPVAPAPAPLAEPAKSPAATAVSAHAHVGPEKCMMCHRIQYKSWNESKHKAKGLDCEGCHGNGADYKTIAVMKDLAAAKKAGLILPDVGFCKKCHPKADASFLPTAHAHKAK